MKNFYKLYITSKNKLEEVIDQPVFEYYSNKINIKDNVGTIVLSICDSGHPDKDEVSNFILMCEDIKDITLHSNYPLEDNSLNDLSYEQFFENLEEV